MMKLENENFELKEIELIATYEEMHKIPRENTITEWYGDMNMHELKLGVNAEQARETLDKALAAIKMSREEFGKFNYTYRSEVIDKIRKNMPKQYEVVTIFNVPMLFTNARIPKEEVPPEMFRYDIRDSDECNGDMSQIKDWVLVNHWGTVLSKIQIKPKEINGKTFTTADGIDMDEDDYNYTGEEYTVQEFLENYDYLVTEYCEPEQDETITMS